MFNPSEHETPEPDSHHENPESSPTNPPLVVFENLAQGSQEILIDFRSQIYRLRVTRNGKLILNK